MDDEVGNFTYNFFKQVILKLIRQFKKDCIKNRVLITTKLNIKYERTMVIGRG